MESLKNAQTWQLVEELKQREGVEHHLLEHEQGLKINNANGHVIFEETGPAIVLYVVD